jgi:sarcosine oxidase subunit beta
MRRYSALALARKALRQHAGWQRAWAEPEPRASCEIVIVGAGAIPPAATGTDSA